MVSRYSNDDESDTGTALDGGGNWVKDSRGVYVNANRQAPPADTATQPPTVPAGQSSDASNRSTLGKMWDAWTSRPENNAAMINFGLSLMSPIQAGESRLGHWAQAIGAGAEGSSANVAQQEAREKAEEASDIAERKTEVEEERGSAYSQYMRNRNTADKLGMQQSLRQQADWNRWRTGKESAEDILNPGMSTDTTTNIIRQRTGNKTLTKSQILRDPALTNMAEQIIKGGGGGGGPQVQEGATATGPGGAKIVYRGGQWVPLRTPAEE